jgi:D-Tyr-tRNAtyr deacylase
MTQLGNGLFDAEEYADALSVREAELAMLRRLGARERNILTVQTNLATSYEMVGQEEQAVHMQGEVYAGTLQLFGEEHEDTLIDANNYASLLVTVKRFEEAKSLLRKKIPVVRRVLGESEFTLTMKKIYARALYEDTGATLDDLREAVATLEETERIVRRMLGDLHPTVAEFEVSLHNSRAALRARETPLPASSISNEIN